MQLTVLSISSDVCHIMMMTVVVVVVVVVAVVVVVVVMIFAVDCALRMHVKSVTS